MTQINVTITISDQRIKDLLCSAFEGGSNRLKGLTLPLVPGYGCGPPERLLRTKDSLCDITRSILGNQTCNAASTACGFVAKPGEERAGRNAPKKGIF